jgi:hypothetical protein
LDGRSLVPYVRRVSHHSAERRERREQDPLHGHRRTRSSKNVLIGGERHRELQEIRRNSAIVHPAGAREREIRRDELGETARRPEFDQDA